MNDFKKLPWDKLLKKYDKYSFKHWMSENANVSKEAIDYVG